MRSPDCLPKENPAINKKELLPLVVILGPTAAGKSEISIQLAEKFNGEIVSADSRLFYRGMDIGTAKPSIQDRSRVPHHLIDVADPDDVWSLAVFQKEADKAIQSIHSRQHLPFLVGGTGQFIRSIIEGWSIPVAEPNRNLREALAQWGENISPLMLHSKLAILDPPAAKSIDPTNIRRTIRALEVIFTTGRRFSEQRKIGHLQYNTLLLGLSFPRPELYQRIDDRIIKMINSGLIDEVKRLLDQGYSPELPTLSAIGYGEIIAYINGNISLDEAIQLMKRRTRSFVRRQANWFKENDSQIHWFLNEKHALSNMSDVICQWLSEIN